MKKNLWQVNQGIADLIKSLTRGHISTLKLESIIPTDYTYFLIKKTGSPI